jgi:hypothetical protein
MTGYPLVQGAWAGRRYAILRPFFSVLGRTYRVYNEEGMLVAFVRHPLFRLRPEYTIFADEEESQPLLTVKSRRLIGWNLEHDVWDARTGVHLASLRSRGLSFMVRDAWDLLDDQDHVAGEMLEQGSYLLRRLVKLIPGHHSISLGGRTVAHLEQRFRWFTKEFDLEVLDPGAIDPRFLVAASILAVQADVRRES